ncbi:MAG TPA: DUF5995 family protein [Ornithinimicrobium sp.]|nr:DUF5995 family protein [Ornithinimicrobium sp.]
MDSIDDAVAGMDRILERALRTHDPRGVFACVYRAVTVRVRDGIHAGEFDDGERMERFDVEFARLYLDAVADHALGRPVAASWAVTFEAPARGTLALQHLLAGMNAHINLDLGIAAATVQQGRPIADLRDDFERISDVLAAMVDRMQEGLARVSPWTAVVDRVACRYDECLSAWSIGHARRRAWDFAELLVEAGDGGRALVAEKDRRVARLGQELLHPGMPLRWVVAAAARRERRAVREMHDLLLQPL